MNWNNFNKNKIETSDWLKNKIDVNVLSIVGNPIFPYVFNIPSEKLFFNKHRFDLIAKYKYLENLNSSLNSSWHKELYLKHINAFSCGENIELNHKKNSEHEYLKAFEIINNSIKKKFDSSLSVIPVNKSGAIIDGSHRLASAFYHKKNVSVVVFDYDIDYDANFFRNRGLPEIYLDEMARNLPYLYDNFFVCILFPCGENRDAEVKNILEKAGEIYYYKELFVNNQSRKNLIREIYFNEEWIGTSQDGFMGADRRAKISFKRNDPIKIYLFKSDKSLKVIKKTKERIRDVLNLGNYTCHINDYNKEARSLSSIFFNSNSLSFLNEARPTKFKSFEKNIFDYKETLKKCKTDESIYSVDSGSVLSAYGIRDSRDIDYLNIGHDLIKKNKSSDKLDNHNKNSVYYNQMLENLILDPRNYFYHLGYKFISLKNIIDMKMNRAEIKDRYDLILIAIFLSKLPGKVKAILRILLIYVQKEGLHKFGVIPPFIRKIYKK